MKYRQRTDHRAVGLEKLPDETLHPIIGEHEIKTIGGDKTIPPANCDDIEDGKTGHRHALIQLDRMPSDAVAEIVAPGQRRRRAVGEIVHSRKIAADAADGDADRERQRKAGSGSQAYAPAQFVEFDGDNAAGDRALDRSSDPRKPRKPEIESAEQVGAEAR